MARYYYNPRVKRLYRSIVNARNCVLHWEVDENNMPVIMRTLPSDQWSKLTDDNWCKSHPEQAAQWLNLIQTHTRYPIEIEIHKWLYQLIHRAATADG